MEVSSVTEPGGCTYPFLRQGHRVGVFIEAHDTLSLYLLKYARYRVSVRLSS